MKPYTGFELEVKTTLLSRGITVAELAEKLGITQPYLSDILAGARKGIKQKIKIAEILGISKEKIRLEN